VAQDHRYAHKSGTVASDALQRDYVPSCFVFSLQSEQTLVSRDVLSTLSGTTFWANLKKAERPL
jgi:hypothetical protein